MADMELGFCCLWAGLLDDAEPLLRRARDGAAKIADIETTTFAVTYLAFSARLRGDSAATERLARELLRLAEQASMPSYTAVARGLLGWAMMRAGEVAEAERLCREALAVWARLTVSYPLQWVARLTLLELLATRDTAAAADQARAILDPGQQRLAERVERELRDGLAAHDGGGTAAASAAFARAVAAFEAGVLQADP
jgi:hypothetical protein